MRVALLAALCLVGCGRVGYAGLQDPASDAGTRDAGTVDAGARDAGPLDAGTVDASTSDAGDPSDGGPLDAGVIDAAPDGGTEPELDLPCGTTVVLEDDFEDGVTSAEWLSFADPGMSTTEETGHAHVRFAAAVDPDVYGGYQATAARDLTGGCLTVEVPVVPDVATEALTYAKIIAGTWEVEILEVNGFLVSRVRDAGVLTTVGSLPYDPVAHLHWRIRDAGGSIRCEHSADGVTFQGFATIRVPLVLDSAVIAIGAGAYVPTFDAGDAQFESITVTAR